MYVYINKYSKKFSLYGNIDSYTCLYSDMYVDIWYLFTNSYIYCSSYSYISVNKYYHSRLVSGIYLLSQSSYIFASSHNIILAYSG